MVVRKLCSVCAIVLYMAIVPKVACAHEFNWTLFSEPHQLEQLAILDRLIDSDSLENVEDYIKQSVDPILSIALYARLVDWLYDNNVYKPGYRYLEKVADLILEIKDTKDRGVFAQDFLTHFSRFSSEGIVLRMFDEVVGSNAFSALIKQQIMYFSPALYYRLAERCEQRLGDVHDTNKLTVYINLAFSAKKKNL